MPKVRRRHQAARRAATAAQACRKDATTGERPGPQGSGLRPRHLGSPDFLLAALVQLRSLLLRWTHCPRLVVHRGAELHRVGALRVDHRVRRRRSRGTGPYVQGSAPGPPDRNQSGPRGAGLPPQAGRLELVMGRPRWRWPPPSWPFCPLECPSSRPDAGAEGAPGGPRLRRLRLASSGAVLRSAVRPCDQLARGEPIRSPA